MGRSNPGGLCWGVRRFTFREFVMDLSAAELNRRGLVPVGRFVRDERETATLILVQTQLVFRRTLESEGLQETNPLWYSVGSGLKRGGSESIYYA